MSLRAQTPTAPVQSRGNRYFILLKVALLLFLGCELWLVVMHGVGMRRRQPTMLAAAALIALAAPAIPGVRRWLIRLRHPSPPTRLLAGVGIALFASAFLYYQAVYQHRDFLPKFHDEFSYMIQTRMLAHGRLWEPQHPLADFFETFQLITRPVYASMYFPGAAMFYAPGIWLHLPNWVIPLLLTGILAGMIFCIFTELIDVFAGIIGAVGLLSLPNYRLQSLVMLSNIPALLLAMGLIWTWMHWRINRDWKTSALMGALAGWLAITRPLEAVMVIVPLGLFCLLDLRAAGWQRVWSTLIIIAAAAAPFVALQLSFNHRVTGTIRQTPFDFYARRILPGTAYGFHSEDARAPDSPLPQVQASYRDIVLPTVLAHTPRQSLINWRDDYFRAIGRCSLPHSLFIVLLPVGLLGITDRRRLMLAAMIPMFIACYYFYTFFLDHYITIIMPAMLLLVALAADVGGAQQTPGLQIRIFLFCAIVALSVSQWPQFDRIVVDEPYVLPESLTIDRKLSELPAGKKIVLFRFAPSNHPGVEPVYNTDVVWPDDAPMIRAHDLGDRNMELYRYYAATQPARAIWLYDRGTDTLTYLGTAGALATGDSLHTSGYNPATTQE